ncbi:hypothetical protein HNQ92_000003 [Rhabdobacter roseus]|uniref:Uncharacterized protein n=1 Tax=Rhabdobacter roseus TaxID=1655419 RepID=A0A840TK08_9BACT|nr:hypothetical protein [Rhabdobacter roseus]MBB5281882.1 hypothetical protein [Rhabdobacter roseus]
MTVQAKRTITQSLSWLLATLLLVVAVGGKSWSVLPEKSRSVPATEKSTATPEKQSEQANVSALSLDAVVTPASSFDFSQQYYVLPPPSWRAIEVLTTVPACFHEFFHFFSYFRKVFGHHIAINAP